MNLLIVAHYIPMPDRQGDMHRLHTIVGMLAKKHAVTFAALDLAGQRERYGHDAVENYGRQLEALGVTLEDGWLPSTSPGFEVVLFEHHHVARARIRGIRYFRPQTRIIVDTVDVAFERMRSELVAHAQFDEEAYRQARENELGVYRQADLVVAISLEERDLLRSHLPHVDVEALPLVFETRPLRPRTGPCRPTLVFVANFSYAANVESVNHFADAVFPLVRDALPDAEFLIVGDKPPPSVLGRESTGIRAVGFVVSLDAIYARCDISVAPLLWGGGLKGKVAEAMAHGLPVVATTVAAKGFGMTDGVELLVADDPSEFADAVVRLARDGAFRDSIARAGWTFVNDRMSVAALESRVDQLIGRVAEARPQQIGFLDKNRMAALRVFNRYVGWRMGK